MFQRKKPQAGAATTISPPAPDSDERRVYRFHDGEGERVVDPLRIWRELFSDTEVDFLQLVEDVETIDATKDQDRWYKANAELIEFSRRVFAIKPVEEGGLTELETKAVVEGFLLYMHAIKKKLDTLQTSSVPTDSSQA